MCIKPITADIVAGFRYDPETGQLFKYGRAVGNRTTSKRHLKVLGSDKREYLAHRIAWFLHYGEQPPAVIDHINRDGTDNRAANLRAADNSTNQQNIAVHTRSQTGVKGIFPIRGGALYRAEVCINGHRIQKHAKNPEALEAWVKAAREQYHTHFHH